MNFDPEALGALLERNRRRAGLTQAQLAELMGTRQPAISRAERGRLAPTLEFLDRWSRATGRRIELDFVPAGKRPARLMRLSEVQSRGKMQFKSWELYEMRKTPGDGPVKRS